MLIELNGIKINYEIIGAKGKWLLFLHGWGGSKESFLGVAKQFPNNRCLLIDFPPFGESGEPSRVLTIYDYAQLVNLLLNRLKIKKVKIISHSFGGRVAILLASLYNKVESLVLTDSAGLKPRFNLKTKLKIAKFKTFKKLGIKQDKSGSSDYQKLTPIMRQTFKNIINEDLSDYCKKITAPTLIIFGEKDKDTPLYMAKKLNRFISQSELIVLENAGHFAYIECFNEYVLILKSFLK